MKPQPVLHRLETRAIERKEIVRRFVLSAEVERLDASSVWLRTTDGESSLFTRWPEGATPSSAQLLRDRELHRGALRVDLLTERIARVRYAPGTAVPENATPMVVGSFAGPRHAAVHADAGANVHIDSQSLRIEIERKPLVIRLRDAEGRELCAIGGREKNQWNQWDSLNTGVCRTAANGTPLAVECFSLGPQEAIYGFGEKFLRIDKIGQTLDLNMLEATGTTTPRSYKNVPFFWSTRGYGVFFNHSCRMTAWIGTLCAADLQIALEDDFLDYFLIAGDPKQILASYGEITGKSALPPLWSFGFWQSKISYRSAAEVNDVVDRMRAADLPLDVVHVDTHWFRRDWCCDLEFDPERFPDPAGWMKTLRDQGVRVSLWQLPYIPEGSRLFDELSAADGFVRTQGGDLYDVGICYTPNFQGRVGCIDFTNPAARRVYQDHLRRLFDLGTSVIKADFGEQAPLDGVYHDGTPGHRAHNLYPLLYNQAVAEVTEQATGESIIWARSAWAGSQRYPLHWGGDSSANWDNLGPQLAGGLSLGLSGFPFWSQDIGGFVGETGGSLLVRWMQAGLFLSHARIHGMGRRELVDFEPEILRIGRAYLRLRYRLLPYLYGSAIDCIDRSLPMARALVVEWPHDPSVWPICDQWLLGDALLVAPILDATDERRVYLPAGVWTNWWSGERMAGARWLDVRANLETLPLWVREGGLVPLGPVLRWSTERRTDEIELLIAPFASDGESRFVVPIDDERVPLRYVADAGSHCIEIGASRARFRVAPLGSGAPEIEVVTTR